MDKILFYFLIRIYHRTKKWKSPFKTKRILIVREDAIGDYVLFRNFFKTLKESEKFKNYHFTFLGNKIYQDLAEHFDKKYISKFIWFNPTDFNIGTLENLKLHFKLKLKGFDYLVRPVHSKTEYIENFIFDLGIKKLFCVEGDTINLVNEDKLKIINAKYDQVIKCDNTNYFEFEKNSDFIQKLVNPNIIVTSLSFNLKKTKQLNKKKKIILFPGASANFRRWSTHNFSVLAKKIKEKYDVDFIIAGSKYDHQLAIEISDLAPNIKFETFAGKTTLTQLVYLINEVDLLISNETSAVHIAAATNTPAICISNGNHFGRFNPYPSTLRKNIITIYPNEEFNDTTKFEKLHEENKQSSRLNINSISSTQVFNILTNYFDNQLNAF